MIAVGIPGEQDFFKSNLFQFKNNRQFVCQGLKNSGLILKLNEIKTQYQQQLKTIEENKKQAEGAKGPGSAYFSPKFKTSIVFTPDERTVPEKVRVSTTLNVVQCKMNLSQIIEDSTMETNQIFGFKFKHQEYLLIDLSKDPIVFKSALESSWGQLHFYLNGKEFHTDNFNILDTVFHYANICQDKNESLGAYNHQLCAEFIQEQSLIPSESSLSAFPLQSLVSWGGLAPEVSVLPPKELQEVFQSLLTTNVPYQYAYDECLSRSLIFGKKLEEKGVIAGQVFSIAPFPKYLSVKNPIGDDAIYFSYHVAPFVLAAGQTMMIIDPTIDDTRPLTLEEWNTHLIIESPNLKTSDLKIEVRNRFSYGTGGASNVPLKKYRPIDLQDASNALERTRSLLENNPSLKRRKL